MSETFTHWFRRTAERWKEGHMTIEEAAAEVRPLRQERKA